MDTDNRRPAPGGGEPTMDTGDWRSRLQPHSRQRIVNELADILKRHIPFSGQEGLQELEKIAVWFEEKIYTSATSQPDYLEKIALQMLTIETKSQNTKTNSLPSNSGNVSKNPPDTASLDSTAQIGNENSGDWQEEIYQKIKVMEAAYLPELTELDQKIAGKLQQRDSLPQQLKHEQWEKLKSIKTMLEHILQFLQVPKSSILPNFKEKVGACEKQIINFLNSHRLWKPASLQQGQQIPPPHIQSIQLSQQSQSQITQAHPMHENQIKPHQQSMKLPGSSVATMQQNNVTSLQHNPLSSLSGVPTILQSTINSLQPGNASAVDPGKSSVTEQPFERFLKVVKSMSPTTLSASVSDIDSVVSMIDRIAGSAPCNGTKTVVGEDLVAMTKWRLQERNMSMQDTNIRTRKLRCYTSAMPLNVVSSAGSANDSFKHFTYSETSDSESTATSSVKRPRFEANHALLKEIMEINQRLIATVVRVSDEDVDPTSAAAITGEGGEGTIVLCSFSAVAFCPSLKSQYASAQMSPIQPLRLLVPTSYPSSSPIMLDKFPFEVSKECDDLSLNAKSRFSISLRNLSQPISLGEIARTWDACARAVILEYAQRNGGGSFSTIYGMQEERRSAS